MTDERTMRAFAASSISGLLAAAALAGCTTVTLQGGDKPIEVNLNVKIEDLIAENPDIF